ncbi:hypothetical protein GmHk_09G026263 [Glycine max]|nr:hypothetical protein GmHk_09G026263 [Glycine max]
MDDFSEDEDQQFFDHINEDSDDEGVSRPMTPLSPPLQYHQPRCPVDLNSDHLPHYIDRHHFDQQQHNVQPPIGALEVGMAFDEKAQCIRAVKEYNIRNHFDCKTDQRRLNFVTHTLRRCTDNILRISVQISQVQLNDLINYPNKIGYSASTRENVKDI